PSCAIERVRGWANPHIGSAGPVSRVVVGWESREREVGDFVMLEPRSGQRRVGLQKLLLVFLFASLDGCTAIGPTGDRSLRFDRKAVEREVIGLEGERLLEIPPPITVKMSGKGEDEVERDVGDAATAQCGDGAPDLA